MDIGGEGHSAIILAGGRGARMGAPKATVAFAGTPMLLRVIQRLADDFDEIIVVAAPPELQPLTDLSDRVSVLRDPVAYEGPVPALQRGLAAASSEIAFVCSCDLPLIDPDIAATICELVGESDAAIPEIRGELQPLHAAYRTVRCAGALATMMTIGEKRLCGIVNYIDAAIIPDEAFRDVDPDLRSFLNVNTPEDLARALKLATREE